MKTKYLNRNLLKFRIYFTVKKINRLVYYKASKYCRKFTKKKYFLQNIWNIFALTLPLKNLPFNFDEEKIKICKNNIFF